MNKRPTFEEFKKEAMKDEELRAEYESLRPEFELLEKFIRARKKLSKIADALGYSIKISLEPKKRR
ncbi:hypothetical protein M1446_00345 [Candidatus Dependentiae bacterium]|nr:hypothetical protein [Candidatus Dependentiae bacterium]